MSDRDSHFIYELNPGGPPDAAAPGPCEPAEPAIAGIARTPASRRAFIKGAALGTLAFMVGRRRMHRRSVRSSA